MSNGTEDPVDGSRPPEVAARLEKLGDAIRAARGSLSQAEVGASLGDVPQTTVSRWERGLVELTLEQVLALETALGLERGDLERRAGYIASRVEDEEDDTFQTLYTRDLRSVIEALEAADTLGIGVILRNGWTTGSDGEEWVEWKVSFSPEPSTCG